MKLLLKTCFKVVVMIASISQVSATTPQLVQDGLQQIPTFRSQEIDQKLAELDNYLEHSASPEQRALMQEVDIRLVLFLYHVASFMQDIIAHNEGFIQDVAACVISSPHGQSGKPLELMAMALELFSFSMEFNNLLTENGLNKLTSIENKTRQEINAIYLHRQEMLRGIFYCLAIGAGQTTAPIIIEGLQQAQANQIIAFCSEKLQSFSVPTRLFITKLIADFNVFILNVKDLQRYVWNVSINMLDLINLDEQIVSPELWVLNLCKHRFEALNQMYDIKMEHANLKARFEEVAVKTDTAREKGDVIEMLYVVKEALAITKAHLGDVYQQLETKACLMSTALLY